jgi:uncharacterized protein DUF4440
MRFSSLFVLVLAAVLVPSVQAWADMNPAIRSALAADSQRKVAIMRNDAVTLDRGMAADVTFITGDGELNKRSEWLSDIRTRKLTYQRIEYSDTTARLFGQTAVIVGRSHVEYRYDSKPLHHDLLCTRVYVRAHERWLLEALQCTRSK